jgi:hypothetical protein
MLRIVHTNTHYTAAQIDAVRQHVIAQLADGNELVVLPPDCTMELLSAPPAYTDVTSATSAIVAESVRRYEVTMNAWAREVEASVEPAQSNIILTGRYWPTRFWLSYTGWRKDMGVFDALRAAWRMSR